MSRATAQRGISLFIVMVIVLLTMLVVVWASRTALFNEMVTGNDSDYQRAVEAAQAMVRDAELDITGLQSDRKTPCASNCRPAPLPSNVDIANGKVYFPPSSDKGDDESDLELLKTLLAAKTPSCVAGICVAVPGHLVTEFWKSKTDLDAMKPMGARYGQYTGAAAGQVGNPLLVSTSAADAAAFYWVEPIPYKTNGSAASREFAPVGGDASAEAVGVVYRITAVSRGLKPGTQAVIQTIFVRKEASGGGAS